MEGKRRKEGVREGEMRAIKGRKTAAAEMLDHRQAGDPALIVQLRTVP